MIKLQKNLILASKSKIRAQILKAADFEFTIIESQVNEAVIQEDKLLSYPEKALFLAKSKALTISQSFKAAMVIGCDQIAVCEGKQLKKSKTLEDCQKQLAFLSAKTHILYTAIAIYTQGQCLWSHLESPRLGMRALSQNEIKQYVLLDKPLYSCGGYYFEQNGDKLFNKIEGETETISGMPITALMKFLKLV